MAQEKIPIASSQETQELAGLLAGLLEPGDVVGLEGDLGAGKTFFAAAVAHALGVPEDVAVTSPTFTLINEHRGRLPIYHMDLYRIGDPGELYDLGLWEYYDGEGVCLVEWCGRFGDLWPERALILRIHLGPEETRVIEALGQGRGAELARILCKRWRGRVSGSELTASKI